MTKSSRGRRDDRQSRPRPAGAPRPRPDGTSGRPGTRGFDPDKPYQVGKRPSNPWLLFAVGVMWVAVGLVVLFELSAFWRIVPAVFAAGVGLYFLRGASATVLRRERRRPRD